MSGAAPPLLELRDLAVRFRMGGAEVAAVRRVDLEIRRGEVLGIIGESGSGKSVTGLALLRLLPGHAMVSAERMRFDGRDLQDLDDESFRRLRGTHLAMVFQDPVGAFNPAKSIGWHLEHIMARAATRADRPGHDLAADAKRWLADVGIPNPERILPLYPHQLSGGMLQRALIALSVALQPDLLIADEPTTNLDNIVERQIIAVLRRLKARLGSAIIFITHDISLAAGLCDRIAVMYAGEIVETAPAARLLAGPAHPYTAGLIETARQLDARADRLREIPGELPSGTLRGGGCLFAPRCGFATEACRSAPPPAVALAPDHVVRCIRHG
ncbi:MAG: ABC transporter ATP-binding protein [Alphaproteobacteria bacterium]|nr:ABC transporter ATP-binding protein [Alphaproteobacteria bacterium]